ncbi:small GTP-binding protein [Histomonas meleagridis]|uniref:small GTP-binding protein n=1 Tax=Histomonas meleagridis TaxID=135588 RepID=UPI00355A3D15|nr:small GTP-binding protein [Histomonas meleagridis]KAH0801792.1 small GTP-binding protein [Histomonas meleagridis]
MNLSTRGGTHIIFIGSTSVGKTTLISRIVEGKFEETQPTTGAAFFSFHTTNENHPIVEIWDTAGMERYRSLNKAFYKEAAAAILVFDLTNYQSFKDLESWFDEFTAEAPQGAVLILVGNKCEMQDEIEVEQDEIKVFATDHKVNYFAVSAKTGEGVQQMFDQLLTLVPKRNDVETRLVEEEKKKCC